MSEPTSCPGKEYIKPHIPLKLTDEERHNTYATIRQQVRGLLDGKNKITCPDCGRTVHVIKAYRCIYCGVCFCYGCARIHFSVPEEWKGDVFNGG